MLVAELKYYASLRGHQCVQEMQKISLFFDRQPLSGPRVSKKPEFMLLLGIIVTSED